jgi:hypothetical protein
MDEFMSKLYELIDEHEIQTVELIGVLELVKAGLINAALAEAEAAE